MLEAYRLREGQNLSTASLPCVVSSTTKSSAPASYGRKTDSVSSA